MSWSHRYSYSALLGTTTPHPSCVISAAWASNLSCTQHLTLPRNLMSMIQTVRPSTTTMKLTVHTWISFCTLPSGHRRITEKRIKLYLRCVVIFRCRKNKHKCTCSREAHIKRMLPSFKPSNTMVFASWFWHLAFLGSLNKSRQF